MPKLAESFTSTGAKLFMHQNAMQALREGRGTAIVAHVLPNDLCDATCAFCSVATREGNALTLSEISGFLSQLQPHGLKAVIISGGGNPILYKCKETGANFNDLVELIHSRGLEIGLITNGLKLKEYPGGRKSWLTVKPETLDKCLWIRISMAGLDHKEKEVYVPDIDPSKTTLGFSYVYHDIYDEPLDKNHGKVSTPLDLITPLAEGDCSRVQYGKDRLPWLQEQIAVYVRDYKPAYVRLLPNCLEPQKIESRCEELQQVADAIDPQTVFVQYKPPRAPEMCLIGYGHPVLNSDGFVYPCDSVVLAAADIGYKTGQPNHKFESPWRICHWSEIGKIYEQPVRSLVDSKKLCQGCVFTKTNELLEAVYRGAATPLPLVPPIHPNFV